jgi:hypothetical protein
MRRLYSALTTFILFASHLSYAQSSPSFGLRGGMTVADLHGDAMQNIGSLMDLSGGRITTQSRTGFHAGAYANIPVSGRFSIEPGLYYSQKGYEMQGDLEIKALDFLGANATAAMQSTYIDAPVLLKANLVKGLQVFAGPQVSYLVKNNLHVEAGALGLSLFKRNMDITDNFQKWDVALTGGVAYQFPNGFNIQASYDHGLSRIDANNRLESYNRAVKVGVGFRF